MTKPLIGLTTYRTPGQMTIYDGELAVVPSQYVSGVEQAGGIVTLVPPQELSSEDVHRILDSLDALIITGGADINPQRYRQAPGPHTQASEDMRDELEDTLLTHAIARFLPILGICRGAQMFNVHLGGTLHQHLPDVLGHDRYRVGDGVFHPEIMTIEPDTLLHSLMGEDTAVGHVYHHQGIDQVADRLRVSARGFDGLVQGVEIKDYPFGVAVQWHPEESLEDIRIFEGLVAAARA
jgi:putative glutamine amidotransferase